MAAAVALATILRKETLSCGNGTVDWAGTGVVSVGWSRPARAEKDKHITWSCALVPAAAWALRAWRSL